MKQNNLITPSEVLLSTAEIINGGHSLQRAYQYLVLGELLYNALIHHFIFSCYTQDRRILGSIVRSVPTEAVMEKIIIDECGFSNIWQSKEYNLQEKLNISYKILGYEYRHYGYTHLYEVFSAHARPYIIEASLLPNCDYKAAVEHYFGPLHFKVIHLCSPLGNETDFQASCRVKGSNYRVIGPTAKQAVENANKAVAKRELTHKQLASFAKPGITPCIFEPAEDGITFSNQEIDKIADALGVIPSLFQYSLLSRSLGGKGAWEYLNIEIPPFFQHISHSIEKSKESNFKIATINIGTHILRFLAFDYIQKLGILEGQDISGFDLYADGTSAEEKQDYIDQALRTSELGENLYDSMMLSCERRYSSKDKYQSICSLLTACFASNISPVKALFRFFENVFSDFYKEQFIIKPNYRISLSSFLASLGARPEAVGTEMGGGIYCVELRLDKNSNTSPVIRYENVSSREAKKEVWAIAYEKVIDSTRKALSIPDCSISKDVFNFVIKKFCKITSLSIDNPLRYYGIINAANYISIGSDSYVAILSNIRNVLTPKDFDALINRITEINKPYYICINERLYSFNDAFLNLFSAQALATNGISEHQGAISEVYLRIVNPTLTMQKDFVKEDIHRIELIPNPSFDLGTFVIDQGIEYYSYILFPSAEITEYYHKKCAYLESIKAEHMGQLLCPSDGTTQIIVMDSHGAINKQIEDLIEDVHIVNITIACGYFYKSGILLLKKTFDRIADKNIPTKLIVGSLQNYRNQDDAILTGIDKSTIRKLNEYIKSNNISLYTCEDRFYHGKIYMFEGENKTVICLGSSNVSKSAFVNNYELNIAFITSPSSRVALQFRQWIDQLILYSNRIETLNEDCFCDNEVNVESGSVIRRISKEQVIRQIDDLTDEEVQFRLRLWMKHNPEIISTELGILALPNYYAFVYTDINLLVLESFISGNAYYCLSYVDSYETEMKNIAALSKTEIFEHSCMSKRGYHIQNRFTLERNINRFFR